MAKTHHIKQDEHLSGIAAQHGFGDFRIILDHPRNAAIKARRDPHVLAPGDQVFIPDRTEKTEQGVTTRVHVFEVPEPPLILRLRVHDLDNRPVANAPYDLTVELTDAEKGKSTDGKGILSQEISRDAKNGELRITHRLPALKKGEPERVERLKFDLKIGRLNPETMLSGQQARLNNLGYFAGFTVDDLDQMRWAIEEFQCDHLAQKPVKKKPEIIPESDDPNAETGVTDKATRTEIRKVHGI